MIIKCNCSSEYQDKEHGKGNRVCNESGNKDRSQATCTVCGSVKNI